MTEMRLIQGAESLAAQLSGGLGMDRIIKGTARNALGRRFFNEGGNFPAIERAALEAPGCVQNHFRGTLRADFQTLVTRECRIGFRQGMGRRAVSALEEGIRAVEFGAVEQTSLHQDGRIQKFHVLTSRLARAASTAAPLSHPSGNGPA